MFCRWIYGILWGICLVPALSLAQTRTLEERVAELEANQSLNIFSFSGTFQTRYDNIISAKQTTPADAFHPALDANDLSYLRMKFQFNVDANVSRYIKFYSRFTTSKNFNTFSKSDVSVNGAPIARELGESNGYSSSAVYLEKAYADFYIPQSNVVFSVGRLPTVDGQPQNYKDGRARLGTYPQLSFNSIFDGFALTYRVDEYLPEDHKLALRVLYTPFSQYSVGPSGYLQSPTDEASGNRKSTQVAMGALQFDYTVDKLGWTETMGIVLQSYQTGDLHYPGFANAGAGIPTGSSLDFALGGTTLAMEFLGLMNQGWDLSLNYLLSSTKSNGTYGGAGFGTDAAEASTQGGLFLLSTRVYSNAWVLGAEYVHGTQDSTYFATNDETLSNFYATKGDAYHVYVTHKFTQNLSLRGGYMEQRYDWTPTGLGANVATDRKIQTGYAHLRLDF